MRSEQIYQFLESYIGKHGYAPSRREIAAACEIPSTNSVQYWLDRLARAGRLQYEPKVSRSIILLGTAGAAGDNGSGPNPLPEE